MSSITAQPNRDAHDFAAVFQLAVICACLEDHDHLLSLHDQYDQYTNGGANSNLKAEKKEVTTQQLLVI